MIFIFMIQLSSLKKYCTVLLHRIIAIITLAGLIIFRFKVFYYLMHVNSGDCVVKTRDGEPTLI